MLFAMTPQLSAQLESVLRSTTERAEAQAEYIHQLNASRERLVAARAQETGKALRERALAVSDAPRIQLGDFNLIAELKLRSPAAGVSGRPTSR